MKLGDLWRWWQNRGLPEHRITEAEAIEHVRQYAEANGHDFRKPSEVHIEGRLVDPQNRKAGSRYVYVIALGTGIPVPFVEVDVVSGEVLAWRSLSR